jgi:serine/threonine-protein kinase
VAAGQLIVWTTGATHFPTKAPYGATITLYPSAGHAPATVPAIPSTDTFTQAQAALAAVGLTATQASTTSATVATGDVISTNPPANATAPYGSAVTVTTSSGPPTTQVPNVYEDSVTAATATLQAAGLTVAGAYGPSAGTPGAIVIYTSPGQGTTVDTGSAVSLYTN